MSRGFNGYPHTTCASGVQLKTTTRRLKAGSVTPPPPSSWSAEVSVRTMTPGVCSGPVLEKETWRCERGGRGEEEWWGRTEFQMGDGSGLRI